MPFFNLRDYKSTKALRNDGSRQWLHCHDAKKKLKGGEGGGRGHNAGRIYLSQFSCSLSRFVGCVLQSNKQLKFCCVHLNTQKKTIARWLCVSLLHCMNPLAPSKKAIKFRLKVCRRCSILLCSQNNTVCMHI